MTFDVTIVGGGIIGLATAHRLLEARPQLKLWLLEKEPRLRRPPDRQQQRRIAFGTLLPARLGQSATAPCKACNRCSAFCRAHGIAHEQCGKIVVATSAGGIAALGPTLGARQRQRLAGPAQIESRGKSRKSSRTPPASRPFTCPRKASWIIPAICEKLGELIRQAGGEIRLARPISESHANTRARGRWRRPPAVSKRNLSSPAADCTPTDSCVPPGKNRRENRSLPRRVLSDQKRAAVSGAAFDLSRARPRSFPFWASISPGWCTAASKRDRTPCWRLRAKAINGPPSIRGIWPNRLCFPGPVEVSRQISQHVRL